MNELTRRILTLFRDDPTLTFCVDPFALVKAGLQTKDLPESWELKYILACIEDARRLFREEVDRDAETVRQTQA